ncbi:MAG: Lar family restriction alleviation protein [Oscillospiraceae bacterium]
MPEIKLKPCPFCGEAAQMMERLRGQTQKVYYVCCMSRKCPVNPYTDELKSISDVAYWWNKRADTNENIVHCKDCKHLKSLKCYDECELCNFGILSPEDFCSRGERRNSGPEK